MIKRMSQNFSMIDLRLRRTLTNLQNSSRKRYIYIYLAFELGAYRVPGNIVNDFFWKIFSTLISSILTGFLFFHKSRYIYFCNKKGPK